MSTSVNSIYFLDIKEEKVTKDIMLLDYSQYSDDLLLTPEANGRLGIDYWVVHKTNFKEIE